ncbi:MAG: sulfatase-like hydrolase/transferase, partial [Planctomycetota bacterium]
TDPAETNNLIESTNASVVAARRKLEAVVQSFPGKDAAPQYDPTPPQRRDKKIKGKKGRK